MLQRTVTKGNDLALSYLVHELDDGFCLQQRLERRYGAAEEGLPGR